MPAGVVNVFTTSTSGAVSEPIIRDPRLRTVFSFHPLLIGGHPFRATAVYGLIAASDIAFAAALMPPSPPGAARVTRPQRAVQCRTTATGQTA